MTRAALLITLVLLPACFANTPAPPTAHPQNDLERRFTQNPNDVAANVELAEQAEMQGDLLRAEQYYVRAEALGVPTEKILPRILGVLVKARRYDEALTRCRDRLSQVPTDRATRFLLAALLQGRDRNDLAEHELSILLRANGNDGDVHLALGRLYRDGYKDTDRALPHLQKYLELEPNGADAAAVRFELAEMADLPPSEHAP